MKTIWKGKLSLTGGVVQTVTMPSLFTKVKVRMADEDSTIDFWTEVDTDGALGERKCDFIVIGTGHERPDDGFSWIGTVIHGVFRWHVYMGDSYV